MDSMGSFLVEDHARCDRLLRLAIEVASVGHWAEARVVTADFAASLERHLLLEERIVFPAFERKFRYATLPTVALRSEHLRIRAVVQRLRDAAAQHDADSFITHADALLLVMHQHSQLEERMLYPMIERALGRAAQDLVRSMKRFGCDEEDEHDCQAAGCDLALID